MSANVFCLTWADYECKDDHYFLAPEGATQEDFQNLCNSLLKDAAVEACRVGGMTWGGIPDDAEERSPSWVGWANLVHVLAYKLLPQHGYQPVQLPTVCYAGTSIIRDREYDDEEKLLSEEAFNIIVQHNKKVEDNLNAHHEELRKQREAEKALERTSEQVEAELAQD